jgi:hypothetical protein
MEQISKTIKYPRTMPSSHVTVVTAFYPLPNGPTKKQYRLWLRSLCKIPCALVIFTTEQLSLELHQWRLPFLDKTQIRVRKLETFAMACPLMMDFWRKEETKDPNRLLTGKTAENYAIAAIKQECVRIIVGQNPFFSKWFVWIDATLLRFPSHQNYFSSFPNEIPRMCEPGRISLLEMKTIPDSYLQDWREKNEMKYPFPNQLLGAGCMAGDADAWIDFGEAYKDMLQDFAVDKWFCGCETDVYFAMLMERYTRKPYQLFIAKKFEDIDGLEWLSLPPMLAGTIDAEMDMRFEEEETKT